MTDDSRLDAKLRREILLGRYVANPLMRGLFRVGLTPPFHTLIETKGRKTGLVRRVPVGYSLQGDTVWVVAQHGRRAGWVRNLEADPRVRLLHKGDWLEGRATIEDGDDPHARIRTFAGPKLAQRLLSASYAALETRPVSVRISLDRS